MIAKLATSKKKLFNFVSKHHIFVKVVLLVILVTFAILICIQLVFNHLVRKNNYSEITFWDQQIKRIGAENAYFKLKKNLSKSNYVNAHREVHSFGEALYINFGLSGTKYCDDFQQYGCFHALIGAYIAEKGPQVLDNPAEFCSGEPALIRKRCFHGVGHGLIEYFGKYNLNEALRQCKKLGELTFDGCSQGALMEYFAPFKIGAKTVPAIQFDDKNPFGPCDKLDADFKAHCYFFVPNLFWPNKIVDDVAVAESICLKILDPQNKALCFSGVGIALQNNFNFDHERSKRSCLEIADKSNKISCLGGVKWNTNPKYNSQESIKNICIVSNEDLNSSCNRIVANLSN